uniref:Delta-like protein n=1 Tax=Arion vulgaris TaxID=1028688 RepID=A0A0B7BHR0_9EUPU
MGARVFGNLLAFFVLFGAFRLMLGSAVIEMKFMQYSSNCKEDLFSECDPKFTFCLDIPSTEMEISPCYYKSDGESGYFHDQNNIDLSALTSIQGIANPWIVHVNQLIDTSFVFVAKVRDDDDGFWNLDDDLVTFGITLKEKVYPSLNQAGWSSREMSRDSYTITFQIRVYCDANYYTEDCSKYCKATDQPYEHYTCKELTGEKICMAGWTGQECTSDIDECTQNPCGRGHCQNFPGSYVCYCPAGNTGKNCEITSDPCENRPCSNNAACISDPNRNYICKCVDGWEGERCDIKSNPCNSAPCQHGMPCIPRNDNSYFCKCQYPLYTGINCEQNVIVEDTTTEGNNTNHHNETTTNEVFEYWYIILIVALVIAAAVIIVVILLLRRRRVQRRNTDHGFFDNIACNVSTVDKLGDTESGKMCVQAKFVPTTMKSSHTDPMVTDNIDGKDGKRNKPMSNKNKGIASISELLAENERANDNVYSSMGNVYNEQWPEVEENPYSDLDEITRSVNKINEENERATSCGDYTALLLDDPTSFHSSS